VLIDLATAIDRAGLTDRQRQALALVYFEDLTQVDAAERMKITQQAVTIYLDSAAKKIASVYEKWAWMGEGYDFNTEADINDEIYERSN
jgi:DNA-directed RNA polymerase specialized sigma24 family protein